MIPLSSSWPSLRRRVAGADALFLFLDFDGTLVPIAAHPSQARLPARRKRLIRRLVRRPDARVAVVSGRALRDLRRKVGIMDVIYVGNHGLELQGSRLRYVNPAARAARPLLRRLVRRLRSALRPVRGAWVEDKGLTASVHLRAVAPEGRMAAKNLFYEVVSPHLVKREIRVTLGKMVYEVRPPARWTKGAIVQWLLTRCRWVLSQRRVLPVYVGDDQTDEDAFRALSRRGVTVRVGRDDPTSGAQFWVDSPAAVERLLRQILDLRSARGRGK